MHFLWLYQLDSQLIFPEISPTKGYNLPDEMNFLEIGGVYHPLNPPLPGVSALNTCFVSIYV